MELPTLEGFEPDPALRRLHGRRERLAQLLRSFAESHNGESARLLELLAQGDSAAAKRRLHTIKGTAGTLGLVGIADDARRLETALSLIDEAGGQARVEALPDLAGLERRIGELRAALDLPVEPEPAAEALAPQDLAALGELLAALRPYLEEHELVPDDLVDELKRLMAHDLPGLPLSRLHRHLFEFDHAAAMSVLDTLRPWEIPLMDTAA
jgi:two-component system, sensor histidine kinase and response regulator